MRANLFAPGLAVVCTIGFAALFLSQHYATPVMLFSLLLGMALSFLAEDERSKPGIEIASSKILKFGIAMIGLRLTFGDLQELGLPLILILLFGIFSTIGLGILLAKIFKTNQSFGLISGAAVGICGASAALAMSATLPNTRDRQQDTLLVVMGVTLLSTIAMIGYPILCSALGMNDQQTGLFLGATIHDVAQVVGAGYSISDPVGDQATLTKLARVSLLIPVIASVVMVVSAKNRKSEDQTSLPKFPLFLIFFVIFMTINSTIEIPTMLSEFSENVSRFALIMAMSAIGMKSGLRQVFQVGMKPFLILSTETVWLVIYILIAIKLFY